jgi:hypothetical protein
MGADLGWVLPSILPSTILPKIGGYFLGFLDPIFATIEVRLEKVGLGSHSLEFFGHPTSNPTLNL